MKEKIFDMVKRGVSLDNIILETGLNYYEIYEQINFLKNMGYNVCNKYLYNGKNIYYISNTIDNKTYPLIEFNPSVNEIDMVIISDLHMGSERERYDSLYNVYNFCDKENIHFVINAGDVMAGLFGNDNKRIGDFKGQIKHVIDDYPLISNIITFICFGNHDFHSFKVEGLDGAKVICDKRHDLVNLGYGFGMIGILDDKIYVCHSGTCKSSNVDHDLMRKFIISGGGHRFKMCFNSNFVLYPPTLSDLKFTNNEFLPGFVKVKFLLEDNKIKLGFFDHYLVSGNNFYRVGNFIVDFDKILNNSDMYNKDKKLKLEI